MEGILDYTIKQKQKQELEQIPKQESITIPIEHYNLLKDIDNYGHRLGARFLNTNITFVRQQTYWLAEFGIKTDFDKLTKLDQIIEFGLFEFTNVSRDIGVYNVTYPEIYKFTFSANGPTDYAPINLTDFDSINLASPVYNEEYHYRTYLSVLNQVFDIIKFLSDDVSNEDIKTENLLDFVNYC